MAMNTEDKGKETTAENKIRALQTELQQLHTENKKLKAELERVRKTETKQPAAEPADTYAQFIKAKGVLWKKAADGNLENLAYCPKCRLVLLPVPSDNPKELVCTRCKFKAPFCPSEIRQIAKGIQKKEDSETNK